MKRETGGSTSIENQDYVSYSQNCEKPSGGRPSAEYGLTLNMAKELCMVENNDKGREARRYFIQKEKEALSQLFRLKYFLSEFTKSI